MIRPTVASLLLGAALQSSAGQILAQSMAAEPPTLTADALLKLSADLRRGGYVIYFRHLDTREDQEDRQPVDLGDCSKQRNLSAEGIRRGKEIAAAVRGLRIPIGEVVASPFCRTVDTGRLIAGTATVDAELFFAIALPNAEKRRKGTALRALMARAPAAGMNRVIIGHTANLMEAVGLWPKPEGVAYVFQADAQGRIVPLARIEPDTWKAAGFQQ